MIGVSRFVSELRPYAFAEIDRTRQELEKRGVDVIDFGVGDPSSPTPGLVRSACRRAVDQRSRSGYPSYVGSDEFRGAVSAWFRKRFGVALDPETEVTATIGSKEAIFTLPLAYLDAGDGVLVPDPGYPPYTTGAKARGARCAYLPLIEDRGFLPDLTEIPEATLRRCKMLWLNYPNNPTTKIAPGEFYKEAADFCIEHGILLASDEAYSELYYERKPCSVLSVPGAEEVALVFNSLSKRSSMTCYRIGFVVGRSELLEPFRKVQTQIHSGAPTFVQDAAVAALSDEDHVEALRREYWSKRDALVRSLRSLGLPSVYAEGTFYVWARVPGGYDSLGFSRALLTEAHINTVPGKALSQASGARDGFVRFALVPSLDRTLDACDRIENLSLGDGP